MREADNKSWSIFLSVVGVYVRTSSLNDKHSCQLFRKVSSLVLLSSSVSTANLSCLLATTFSSLGQLHLASIFWDGQALLLVIVCVWRPFLSLSSPSRSIFFASYPQSFPLFFSLWSSVSFKFLISKWTLFFSFFFVHAKALAYRKWITRVSLV